MKEKTPIIMEFTDNQLQEAMKDEAFNIEMNLFSGLEPEYLQKDEVEILKRKYGNDWFYKMGYTDDWKKPDCE